jgi:hypothetical protein
MMYQPVPNGPISPPGPGSLTLTDLHRLGLLDAELLEALAEVLEHIDCGESFIDDRRLLLAWLDAFELLSNGESLIPKKEQMSC